LTESRETCRKEFVPTHPSPLTQEVAMSAIPTTENRGLLPAGTVLPVWGEIVRRSETAYSCVDFSGEEVWVSFDRVHGRPSPVESLVVFA
jgi:hypothetical protein